MNTPEQNDVSLTEQKRVCPSCGSCPWDFANPGKEQENQPSFCQDCGDKLILRSELPRDIWKDPYVKERLKSGVPAWDIAVCRCPECHQLGYYNEGSTFSCRFCDLTFYMVSDDGSEHDIPEGVHTCSTDEVIRLDDTVTETTDGYENRTL